MAPTSSGTTSNKSATQDPEGYLARGWFPVNQSVLRLVSSRVAQKLYDNDRNLLVNDLKSDFSLFSYCIRKLGTLVDGDEKSESPIDLLRKIEVERLKELFDFPNSGISPHIFDSHQRPQAARIKHLLVSSSFAETAGIHQRLDADLAFICALGRQLGTTLVAFNYPRIYTQALNALHEDQDNLEHLLRRALGFSPMQLGTRIALSWNSNPIVRVACGDVPPETDEEDPIGSFRTRSRSARQGDELRKICETGEELAKLNDAEHFPASAKRWDRVMNTVVEQLGPKGFELVKERIAKYQQGYLTINPDLFKVEVSRERNLQLTNAQYAAQLLSSNTFLAQCPVPVRETITETYHLMERGQVSTKSISHLAAKSITIAGFKKGCIFLADFATMRLVPILRLGECALSDFRPIQMSDISSQPHPIADAMSATTPVRQEGAVIGGEVVSYVAGGFGNSEKSGVIYLEMGKELTAAEPAVALTLFRAIKACIVDALNLRQDRKPG